jgi:hypothetical protein
MLLWKFFAFGIDIQALMADIEKVSGHTWEMCPGKLVLQEPGKRHSTTPFATVLPLPCTSPPLIQFLE